MRQNFDSNTYDTLHIYYHLTVISKQNMNFLILYGGLNICYHLLLLLFQASFSYVHKNANYGKNSLYILHTFNVCNIH